MRFAIAFTYSLSLRLHKMLFWAGTASGAYARLLAILLRRRTGQVKSASPAAVKIWNNVGCGINERMPAARVSLIERAWAPFG